MTEVTTVGDTTQTSGGRLGGVEVRDRHILKRLVFGGKDKALSFLDSEEATVECAHCAESEQQKEGLRRIGHFLSATIDALAAHIVVLDSSGAIVAANAGWRRFGKENQGDERLSGVGINYFTVCNNATDNGVPEARSVAVGIHRVLTRQQKEFSLTYACHSPTKERWFPVLPTMARRGRS
jgi:PAS domain-containing protein